MQDIKTPRRQSVGKPNPTPKSENKRNAGAKQTPISQQKRSRHSSPDEQFSTPNLNTSKKESTRKSAKKLNGTPSKVARAEVETLNQNVVMQNAKISTPTLNTSKNANILKSAKKIKNSPGKAVQDEIKTPNQNLGLQSQQKNKSNSKRTSFLNGEENVSPPKKQKLLMFSGTSNLNSSSVALASEVVLENKKGSEKSHKQNQQKANELVRTDNLTRTQRKRLKSKNKRLALRKQQRAMLFKVKRGDANAAVALADIRKRIQKLSSLDNLSATGKKKLRTYKRALKIMESNQSEEVLDKEEEKVVQSNLILRNSRNKLQNSDQAIGGESKVKENRPKVLKKIKKQDKKMLEFVVNKSDSSSESDYDVENTLLSDKVSETMNVGEESEEEDEISDDNDEDSGEDQNEDSGEDQDSESDEEEEDGESGIKQGVDGKNLVQSSKKNQLEQLDKRGKKPGKGENIKTESVTKEGESRYTLFVKNLPFNLEQEEVIEHFKKIGQVIDVRMPVDRNTKKPRGFAFVEVSNEDAYQKALSLNNTVIKGRRISVKHQGKQVGNDKVTRKVNVDNEPEQQEEDDENDDNEDEEEGSDKLKQFDKKSKAPGKGENVKTEHAMKKSRYVVFVGNLPYNVEKEEIIEHFNQIGQVVDVRIPLERETNKPRGFAYVEVTNEDSYQKALSLQNTFIKGRRINVQYTQGGNRAGDNKKKEIKAKNFKLSAMRKQGMLAGSVKESQKRAARRNNAK